MVSLPLSGAYWILYCDAKSSSELTGDSKRETVRKAAKLAVYDAMMMKPNNHHVAAINLPDRCFGVSPPPFQSKHTLHAFHHYYQQTNAKNLPHPHQ